ncbi:hypothetical protein EV193_112151 [Herbihabitans rhizosphaerae]|uniref:Uncharacterized protein n=1 Tax=Herbihabitans rhizosphaerae TaxID=1872711 RepID=A0A4Q7KH02_9PSEU|nr:hypothetical protein EV193_112151 [Herbihabitans rhizosphaerae]
MIVPWAAAGEREHIGERLIGSARGPPHLLPIHRSYR